MSMEESVQHVVMMAIQEVGVNLIYERQSTVGFHFIVYNVFFLSADGRKRKWFAWDRQ